MLVIREGQDHRRRYRSSFLFARPSGPVAVVRIIPYGGLPFIWDMRGDSGKKLKRREFMCELVFFGAVCDDLAIDFNAGIGDWATVYVACQKQAVTLVSGRDRLPHPFG